MKIAFLVLLYFALNISDLSAPLFAINSAEAQAPAKLQAETVESQIRVQAMQAGAKINRSQIENSQIKQVSFRLRSLNAFHAQTLNTQTANPNWRSVDALNDLQVKLAELPFTDFKLISNEQVKMKLGEKQSLRLGDGDLITLKVLYRDPNKVGLWYHWTDANGMELLDTRLHLNCTTPLVTVVEGEGHTNKVLAINLE